MGNKQLQKPPKKLKVKSYVQHHTVAVPQSFLKVENAIMAISFKSFVVKKQPEVVCWLWIYWLFMNWARSSIKSTSWIYCGLVIELSVDRVSRVSPTSSLASLSLMLSPSSASKSIFQVTIYLHQNLFGKTLEKTVIVVWVAHYLVLKFHVCCQSHGTISKFPC